jgi:VWFA-related protein
MKALPLFTLMGILIIPFGLKAQTQVSGTITSNTTWSTGSSYVLTANLTIRNSAVLTIQNGVNVELNSYTITVGSTSAATLNAESVTFLSTASADHKIVFQDGGKGTINRCSFNNVYIDIDADAGSNIELTNNVFTNVLNPLTTDINRIPIFSGNMGSPEWIGLAGTLAEDLSLRKLQWKYKLTGSLLVRSNATLTIESSVILDLNTSSFNLGSTTAGHLIANEVEFSGAGTSDKIISFRDGSTGSITSCNFDNVAIDIAPDAGEGISIQNNDFQNVKYPIMVEPARLPVLHGNTGPVNLIGLSGAVTADAFLPKLEWGYLLSSSLTVRGNATLTLTPETTIDLGSYNILIGSSTSGELLAERVNFQATGSSDRYIQFADEGKGSMDECTFDNVYVNINEDAGTEIYITNNSFEQVQYPVKMNPARPPVLSGNTATEGWIALKGSVKEYASLPVYQWDYILAESVIVRDASVLNLNNGVRIFLNNKNLYVGSSSTNTGNIEADGVYFYDLPNKNGKLYFRANSAGSIMNSSFEKCRLYLEGASPIITSNHFYHCGTAVYLTGLANPVMHNNDFYNNEIAIDHRGSIQINAENNFWGHPGGPRHTTNPAGIGETVNGIIDFEPFLNKPNTGTIRAELEPEGIIFGNVITGQKRDSSFLILNTGDIDLMISNIESSSSVLSVEAADQLWVLPDSSVRIKFSLTALQPGDRQDTIKMETNDIEHPSLNFRVEAEGVIESLLLNFYHIDVDSFPVVKCHFSITDQAFLPIRMLVKSNLGVSEQSINIPDFQLMSRSDYGAISVALVTDRSGSMMGQKLRDAKSAAIDFVNQLSPIDQAALVSFSNSSTLNQNFTSDKSSLITAINSLRADGATALFDAMFMAIDQVKDKPGIKALLALSDGLDNRSTKTPSDIINYANQYGVNIYTIGLGAESEPTMSMIARQTGGQFFYSPTSTELALIYRMISGQLQNLYVVRYLASEILPFPRKVELRVNIYNQADTAVRFYSMGNAVIDFAGSGLPFKREDFSTNSKDYFYYYVDAESNPVPEGLSFSYYMESNGHTIPCGGEYLGSGIMQFWADFRGIEQPGNYTVTLPDSVDQSGGYLKFTSKPEPFIAVLEERDITQRIDIFAGGSAGVRALAGAIGAGPSIAAASVGASGTGGMGITFERNGTGDEWVTRRLEAGVAVKAEAPDINVVVDALDAGLSAEVTVKGTVGQTMYFENDDTNQALILKAKAAYVLETLSLGGMVVSPFFGIVLTAVQEALVLANPDVNAIYDDLYESWYLGANVEGKVGVEFKIAPAENSGLPEFTLAEASVSMGMAGTLAHFVHTNTLEFGLALATSFDIALLNLEVGNIKLGSLFKDKMGAEVGLGSEYSISDGLQSFNLYYLAYGSLSLNLLQGYYGNLYSVNVPRPVIDKAVVTAGNIINNTGRILQGGEIPGMRVGAGYFSDAMDAFFGMDEDTLGSVENHIVIQSTEEFSKGINAEIKIALDAAVAVGVGLEFGVSFSYLDKLSSVTREYVIAHGKILPTAEYPGVFERDNLFSITNELSDLIDGVIDMVADGLKNLILVGEYLIDAGLEILADLPDYGGKLLGAAENGGSVIINAVDPRNWWDNRQPFMEPQMIRAYVSPRVVHSAPNGKLKSSYDLESKLYLVSNAYNITLLDQSRQPVLEFAPLRLKAAINEEMLTDLQFGSAEKSLAKVYFYNTADMSWTAISADLEAHPDTVGTDISKSGTYAIGIEIFPSHDVTAPEILDHYPPEGGTIQPDGRIWAKLFEQSTGVGIDFGRTSLRVDGIEQDATWDPVNSIIAFKPTTPLVPGTHTYTIQVSDYQGNNNQLTITFSVQSAGMEIREAEEVGELSLYPNPVSENLTIEFRTENVKNCDVAIYDAAGMRVAGLYTGKSNQGLNRMIWGRITDDGKLAGAGMYFVRILLDGQIRVKKVIVQ